MIDVYEYARKNKFTAHSAICNTEFRDIFKNISINSVVEIGTYKGISAAYIAQFANKVYTFDIVDYPEKYKNWDILGVNDKMFFYVVKSRYEDNIAKNFSGTFSKNNGAVDIKFILDEIDFDFAFIDGEHTYRDVKADFELVKRCGRVLFHDVVPEFRFINKFVKELNIKLIGNVAYWEETK